MIEVKKREAEEYLQHYIRLWGLTIDGQRFYTHESLLQPVSYQGRDAMLKIAMEQEEKMGSLMMAWWDGNGAAEVYEYDDNALLMERIDGSRSLLDLVKGG